MNDHICGYPIFYRTQHENCLSAWDMQQSLNVQPPSAILLTTSQRLFPLSHFSWLSNLFPLCFSCQTVHEGRIYQLKLFCDKDYPEKPPSVRFHSRINMTCVNHETGVVILSCASLSCLCEQLSMKKGTHATSITNFPIATSMQVDPKKFGLLANWQRDYTMENILTQLKKEMAASHNRKLVQPPEGTFF